MKHKRGKLTKLWLYFWTSLILNLHRLHQIIGKNLKILIRSRSSALVVIFGPLLIIGLIGLAFNSSAMHDIKVGTYSEEYSNMTNNIIDNLASSNYFISQIDSKDLCIDSVKKGEINLCLVFSKNMQIKENAENKISFYVDYSRVNLVYALMDELSQLLSQKSNEYSLDLTESLVKQIEQAKLELSGKAEYIKEMDTNNKDMQKNIISANAVWETNNLSTTAEELGVADLKEYMEELQENLAEENLSLSSIGYQGVFDQIVIVEETVNDYIDEAIKLSQNSEKTGKYLQTIQTSLEKDEKFLPELKTSLEKVTSGIDQIEITNAENIVTPVVTDVQPVVTEETHMGTMFPTFITLVIMFVCIILGSTLVLNEKNTKAHFRNFITPTRDTVFLIGTYLSCLFILIIQTAIMFFASSFFLTKEMMSGLYSSIYPIFLLSTLFILIGMIIGYLFSSSETTMLAALFVVSASLIFSNTVLPLESIPIYLKGIISLNPFVLSESIFRSLLLFNLNIGDLSSSIGSIWIYVIILMILTYCTMKIYKRKVNK